MTVAGRYQQYRVPRQPGSALVQPAVEELIRDLAHAQDLADSGLEFCGKPLRTVRDQARREAIEAAVDFTSQYRSVAPKILEPSHPTRGGEPLPPIVLSGHQPELFHPGVWFKNFLLSRLGQLSGAVAINFLVDNDVCRSSTIRVPSLAPDGKLLTRAVSFDSSQEALPWEMRGLQSAKCWKQFPTTVQQTLLPIEGEPLLRQLWPIATEALERTGRLGLAIAESRHRLEQSLGLDTLEVPLSVLVSTRAFARFSMQLLAELPRFQAVYNSQLKGYRLAHRIRSAAHPVPELDEIDGWLEAPWWVYRSDAPARQRLWVRMKDDQLLLSDRLGWEIAINVRFDCDNAATQWLELGQAGVRVRPRALLTTMYLRMMVSDLFIHGIGGGKYDQLTDGIMREFFGIEPPQMAVATATLHLPLKSSTIAAVVPSNLQPVGNGDHESGFVHHSLSEKDAVTQAVYAEREKLWQLRYHADRMLREPDQEAKLLADKKRELLANIPPRGEKWEWHREITAVNRRLSELAAEQAAQTKQHLDELSELERRQKVLFSREYSFCLFPVESLKQQLVELSNP